MLVGVVINVALVGMLAPYVRFSGGSGSEGLLGRVRYAYDALPNLLCFAYGWWYTSNNFFYLCRIIHGASIIGSWVKFFFNHGCLQFKCDRFIELQKLKILFHSQIDHLVISFIGLQKHEGLLFSFM